MVLDEADLVFDFVQAEDVAVDAVVDLADSVVNSVEDAGVADNILNTLDLIFDLIETEDVIGDGITNNGYGIFNAPDFVLDFIKTKDAIRQNIFYVK